jgi:tetratricopeptide (TPR) repeat protein
MFEEAIGLVQEVRRQFGDHPFLRTYEGIAYARLGRVDEVRKLLEEIIKSSPKSFFPPTWISVLHAELGQWDQAVDWAKKAYKEHDSSLFYLKLPVFDSLHSDPQFKKLLDKIGLK